jgi:hypothetical protein
MRKVLLFIFLLFIGCDFNYRSNNQINKRTPPVIVIAIDTIEYSVVCRDGDNKVFTIFNNPTTFAITKSMIVGDTLRTEDIKSLNIKF